MSTVPQHLIEEARKLGIVPGAVVREGYPNNQTFTVGDPSGWITQNEGGIYDNGRHRIRTMGAEKNLWATVITPAPSQGLQEGDAVECSPSMFKAIVEYAQALGLSTAPTMAFVRLVWFKGRLESCLPPGESETAKTWLTVPEFLSRLEATKPAVPVIKIMDHEVKFHNNGIQFGDYRVGKRIVLAVAQRMEGKEAEKKIDWNIMSGKGATFPTSGLRTAAYNRIKSMGGFIPWELHEYPSNMDLHFTGPNLHTSPRTPGTAMPYGAFMDAIEALVPKVEDIVIEGHKVVFEADHIVVGCQRIPKQTVLDIAERLKS